MYLRYLQPVTCPITAERKNHLLRRSSRREVNMVRSSSGQLRLVFSKSTPLSSRPLKMSLRSYSKPSRKPKDTTLVRKIRELEKISPVYASALEGTVDALFAQMLGARLE